MKKRWAPGAGAKRFQLLTFSHQLASLSVHAPFVHRETMYYVVGVGDLGYTAPNMVSSDEYLLIGPDLWADS